MKAPRCRLCGKEHWGSCSEFSAVAPSSRRQSRVSPAMTDAPNAGVTAGGRLEDTEPSATTAAEEGRSSAAERQKRWRDKMGDEYRKRNRERMRHVRNANAKADQSAT